MNYTQEHVTSLRLANGAARGRLLGTRLQAVPLRQEIVASLDRDEVVVLDFENVNPTQSFLDELIGALVAGRGPGCLAHVRFLSCSDSVKTILNLVVSDRLADYNALLSVGGGATFCAMH